MQRAFIRSQVDRHVPGHIEYIEFGRSRSGRTYAIVINSVVWYKIRIAIISYDESSVELKELTQHLTYDGAQEKVPDAIQIANGL